MNERIKELLMQEIEKLHEKFEESTEVSKKSECARAVSALVCALNQTETKYRD